MRKVRLQTGDEVILSDTVGFISDLPTELVAAFRATLEEVLEADLILHVRDISHPETEGQKRDVETILEDLGVVETTPRIEVWNKLDLLPAEEAAAARATAERRAEVLALSALSGEGMAELTAAMARALEGERREEQVDLGFDDGRRRAWLFEKGVVLDEAQDEGGYHLRVRWSPKQAAQFRAMAG
jgi:GTP-binding protein HflX